MQTNMRQSSLMVTVLTLLMAFSAWIAFAPTQLGGQVTYVIVDGNSMESKFHYGDLVLIRKASVYQIGDAVTYQNAEMGRFVFHRILDANLDRFILKGDNNSWLDSYNPTTEEIVGKLWVHIPKLGKPIAWLRLPLNLAIAIGLLGGSLMITMVQPAKKGRGIATLPASSGGTLEIAMYTLGFVALAFLGLTIFAFTRPLTRTAGNLSYQQDGIFFYSAAGTPGIYDTAQVRSGEPVFPKLTCYLNVGFGYNIAASPLQAVSGSQQLYARVLDEKSGWQRTLPLTAESTFTGNSFVSTSTLDLCQVQSLVNVLEQETGLHENMYTLEIVGHVAMTATAGGQTIADSFDPAIVFKFDEVHFYLASVDNPEEALRFSKLGMINSTAVEANTLDLLGMQPTVLSIRVIGLSGLLIAMIGLLSVLWLGFNRHPGNEDTHIRNKYGPLLMEVQGRGFEISSSVIDVNSIDQLAHLAERQNTMILHMTLNFVHYYLVQSHNTTYRYSAKNDEKGILEVQPVRSAILNYMINSSENRVIASEPVRDVIFSSVPRNQTRPVLQTGPTEKVILRYALNVDDSE